ncbi:MAG: hypothetical protein KF850_40610 [Labilithrix sp.]|nr:hypothetical protein [Labilithrix sp.]
MNRSTLIIACLSSLLALAGAAACTDDDSTAAAAGPEAGAGADNDDAALPGDGGGSSDGGDDSCEAARRTALLPVSEVSTAEVSVLSEDGTTKTLFVDATAGGPAGAATQPRVYVDLATGSRVDLSDVAAASSTAWDLAIERSYIFTNGGEGGPGQGGARFVSKAQDDVTAADATGLVTEKFFDEDCNQIPDRSGRGFKTSFDDWYDYDMETNKLTPFDGTYVVRGGTGKLYTVRIVTYYANPDGGVGEVSGRFVLRVAPLE